MQLVDMYGNPIKKQELLIEQAAASTTGVRSILSDHQTGGLTPYRLANILRRADEGDATAYLELAEELEEKDTHYLSVIGTRKRAVSQLQINITPASDDKKDVEIAELIKDWLSRDELETELFNMLDAVGKGYSVMEILWSTAGNVWLPSDLKWRDPRWFEFDRETGEELMLKELGGPVPLSPYKFIVHKAQSKSGLAIRGGVVRPCIWMWLFKNFSIKDWVVFAEAYGQPIRLGKYNPGASAEDRKTLMHAVANIGSDAAAVIPSSMMIEFIEAQGKTGTAEVFKTLADFCDQQISKAVLGQTGTTDMLPGGGLAGNASHNDVRGDIERSDAKQLAATIKAQLIKPIVDLNFGVQDRYPGLKIGRAEDVDTKKVAETAEVGQRLGISISKSKLREQLNLPAPEDDDDILVPLPSAGANARGDTAMEKPRTETASEKGSTSFDEAIDALSSNFEQIVTPTLTVVQDILDSSTDYEDFKRKLLDVLWKIDPKEVTDILSQATTAARLAGNAGAEIE